MRSTLLRFASGVALAVALAVGAPGTAWAQRGHGGGHGGGAGFHEGFHGDHDGFRHGTVVVGGFYDPFWFGYGYWWPGYAWGPAFWGPPYWGPGYYGSVDGGIKFDVDGPNPKQAQVFVDGAYAGTLNQFHGVFHRLTIRPGSYKIEVRAPGFRPLDVQIHVQPDKTITYHGAMQPAS